MQWQILHVATDSFSAYKLAAPLASYLNAHGFQSTIVCSPDAPGSSFIYRMERQGLKVLPVEMMPPLNAVADGQAFLRLRRIMQTEKTDLVHTYCSKAGFLGRLAARSLSLPAVHTVQSFSFMNEVGSKRESYLWLERLAGLMTQRLFFLAESEHSLSQKYEIGTTFQRVFVGLGIPLDQFQPSRVTIAKVAEVRQRYGIPEDKAIIGTVAPLVKPKRLGLLLEAVGLLRARFERVHLLVVGGGPLKEELVGRAKELGLEEGVTFTDSVTQQEDMPALYALMTAFCLVAERESGGMVYAEASAMGKPVVATDIAPVNQIILQNQTGLLVPVTDSAESVAANLEKLLLDKQLRIELGTNGLKHIQANYNNLNRFPRIRDEYIELLHSK